jgi:hypothetical protein
LPQGNRIIAEVEEALSTPKILDRDLVRNLLELAKALELGLQDACRTNLELSAMDKNVVAATNNLRDAYNGLLKAYTTRVDVDPAAVDEMVESQYILGQQMLKESKGA